MSNTNKEILAILRHYWKLGQNAVDAAGILREVESQVHGNCHRSLVLPNQLGNKSKRCREVSHDLTTKQAEERVKICKELLANTQDKRFYRRIVTCDEKWICLHNPNKSNQWLSPSNLHNRW